MCAIGGNRSGVAARGAHRRWDGGGAERAQQCAHATHRHRCRRARQVLRTSGWAGHRRCPSGSLRGSRRCSRSQRCCRRRHRRWKAALQAGGGGQRLAEAQCVACVGGAGAAPWTRFQMQMQCALCSWQTATTQQAARGAHLRGRCSHCMRARSWKSLRKRSNSPRVPEATRGMRPAGQGKRRSGSC